MITLVLDIITTAAILFIVWAVKTSLAILR